MKDKLLKISLQFFGADADEDFEDDYEDDEDAFDAEDEEDDGADTDTDDGEDADGDDSDEGGEENSEGAEQDGEGDGQGGEPNDTDALISALHAAGYEGDDLKALTADVKKKSESATKKAAAAERSAANKESKGHVKTGKPSRAASGDGIAGFDRRDVEEMRRAIGKNCTEERARRALEKRLRAQAR